MYLPAFLNAPVEEELYMKKPEGFTSTGPNGETYHINSQKSIWCQYVKLISMTTPRYLLYIAIIIYICVRNR
jgi:hypothetical protein